MKLKHIINENKKWGDDDQEELLAFIKKNCQPFLKESKLVPLYRGIKGGMGLGFIKDIRTDRKSKGSSKWWQMAQYNMEKAGIKATRKNSINCSGDSEDLGMFGNVYRIFPIGKFNYSWHPKIADFNWSALSSSNATENPKYWEFVMKGYKTNDLVGGINSRNEILLSGTQYVCLKSSAEMWVGGGFVRNPDKQINRNLK
jgi:hypothetical protein